MAMFAMKKLLGFRPVDNNSDDDISDQWYNENQAMIEGQSNSCCFMHTVEEA